MTFTTAPAPRMEVWEPTAEEVAATIPEGEHWFATHGLRLPPPVPLPGTTGVRPVSAIEAAPAQLPLIGDFMATEEDTVLYGRGGSTKGTTAAWWALQAVRAAPEVGVYILDYEHHEGEWTGRLRRLGGTEDELGRIHYASPYSRQWTHPVGQLSEVWQHVKEDCDRLEVTLLIIDSMTAASEAGEAMGGKQAADEYFRSTRRIGRRALHLGHVPGNAEKWPERPFGSVHIHNYARETWAVAITNETQPDEFGLSSTEVELRCKKAQDRPKPKPQVITFEYEPDHGAITVKHSERDRTHADLAYEALLKTPDTQLTGKAVAAAILQDTGEKLTEAQVYDAIRRDRQDRFETDKTARPFKVQVRTPK